jgi:hypothetical protein
MAYLVTLNAGLGPVSLPNGQVAQGGQAALLTDDQYVMLSPTAISNLFSAVVIPDAGTIATITVGAQAPTISGAVINGVWRLTNPYMESDQGGPSSSTTPLNTPYETF